MLPDADISEPENQSDSEYEVTQSDGNDGDSTDTN